MTTKVYIIESEAGGGMDNAPNVRRAGRVQRPVGLTPHQKIMRAARNCTGLRLTADEVRHLAGDDAIATCATNDDEAVTPNAN